MTAWLAIWTVFSWTLKNFNTLLICYARYQHRGISHLLFHIPFRSNLYISNLPWYTDHLFLYQLEVGARSILFRWKLWYEIAFFLLLTSFSFYIKLFLDTHLGSASLHTVLHNFSHHFTKSMPLSLMTGKGLWRFAHEVFPAKPQQQEMSTWGPPSLLSGWEWRAEASIKHLIHAKQLSGLFPMEDKALWGELDIDSH